MYLNDAATYVDSNQDSEEMQNCGDANSFCVSDWGQCGGEDATRSFFATTDCCGDSPPMPTTTTTTTTTRGPPPESTTTARPPEVSEIYTMRVSDRFTVKWQTTWETITFWGELEGTGWVSVGISGSGAMPGNYR